MRAFREHFHGALHGVAQLEVNHLEGQLGRLHLGEVQDVVDDAQQGIGAVADGFREIPLLLVQLGVEEQAGHARDRIHGGANLMAHVGQEFGFDPRGLERGVPRLLQGGLGDLELRNVAGDADDAGYASALVVNGHLRDRGPDLLAFGIDLFLQFVDERLAGQDDPLLIFIKFLGLLLRMKIEIGLANDRSGIIQAESIRHRGAAAQEARFNILEINPVGNVIEQRPQQVAFVGQRFLDLLALGHVPKDALDADHAAHRIVERRLEHVDEELVPARRLMGLHRVEVLEGGHDPEVVPVIFIRQV